MKRENCEKYYHGGASGILPGKYIQPPKISGAASTESFGAHGVCKTDKVYVTTDINAAMVYAAFSPKGNTVYEVEPVGVMEPDSDCLQPGMSFSCDRAKVLRRTNLTKQQVSHIRSIIERAP